MDARLFLLCFVPHEHGEKIAKTFWYGKGIGKRIVSLKRNTERRLQILPKNGIFKAYFDACTYFVKNFSEKEWKMESFLEKFRGDTCRSEKMLQKNSKLVVQHR